MAATFKTLDNKDITNTRTLLHESIPITGTIVSGTYGGATVALGSEPNIKTYSHGMFESVYDYPYLSSSANHIFDLTVGYSSDSVLSGAAQTQNAKKINIYNQMAAVLMGHDVSGNIQKFDEDGNIAGGGTKLDSCMFVNFARLLTKDEIKKGSFSLQLGASASFDSGSTNRTEMNSLITIADTNAATSFKVNSPTGEYGILYGSGSVMPASTPVGLLFYQAGVAVLTSSIWDTYGSDGAAGSGTMDMSSSTNSLTNFLTGATIDAAADYAFRHRLYNLSFNNTTELNSTIYFCRADNSEFNYSSNPTYLSASKMRVKNTTTDDPVSYMTTVGLYSPDNELLAVAKLSEPLKKTPTNELTLRVRLDY